jgi:hypothetical protein
MASTINADNGAASGNAGLKYASDGTGVLALQTNGTTAVTVDASQNVMVGSTGKGPTADGSIASINSFGYKNRLINGALDIWQRGTSFSNLNGSYGPDRWVARYNDCGGNYTRTTLSDLTGFTYSNQIVKSGTTFGSAFLQQSIETANTKDLLGKRVTFSAWAKKTNTTTQASHDVQIGIGLFTTTDSSVWANSADIAYVYARWTSSGLFSAADPQIQQGASYSSVGTPTAGTVLGTNVFTTTWERYYITLTIPVTTKTITCQIGSESMVQNGGIEFTGMQLELGGQATPYEYRPISDELALCQRYYEKSYDIGTAPGTATSTGNIDFYGSSDATSNVVVTVPYKVTKRIIPATITFYNTSGAASTWSYRRNGASGTGTASSIATGQNTLCLFVPVGAAWIVCEIYGHYTVDAEL